MAVCILTHQGLSSSLVMMLISDDLFSLGQTLPSSSSDSFYQEIRMSGQMYSASAMICSLSQEVFPNMIDLFSCPPIDKFVSHEAHRLPCYVQNKTNISMDPGYSFSFVE